MGEPGIGKSRLQDRDPRDPLPEGVRWLEGRCQSFTQSTSYAPLIEVLRSTLGVGAADPQPIARTKLRRCAPRRGRCAGRAAPDGAGAPARHRPRRLRCPRPRSPRAAGGYQRCDARGARGAHPAGSERPRRGRHPLGGCRLGRAAHHRDGADRSSALDAAGDLPAGDGRRGLDVPLPRRAQLSAPAHRDPHRRARAGGQPAAGREPPPRFRSAGVPSSPDPGARRGESSLPRRDHPRARGTGRAPARG